MAGISTTDPRAQDVALRANVAHGDPVSVGDRIEQAARLVETGHYSIKDAARALAADPQHVKTWQYYGMWQVEQGNLLKAADFLEKIEAICGNKTCREYQDLKGGMEGTVTY